MTRYQTTRRVEFRDTDAAGIVHFSAFFTFMEQAEHELLRHIGLSVFQQDEQGEISWPRVHASCDYQGAARFEDELQINVEIERIGTTSVTYTFQFSRDGESLATGKLTTVCCRLSSEHPPQSIEIPASIREALTGK